MTRYANAAGQLVVLPFHVAGTLAADLNIRWQAPFSGKILHVSAVGSDANAMGVEIGTSADADGYITKYSAGVSNTPVEKGGAGNESDFDGALVSGNEAHFDVGDILTIAVDYDYNGGGAGAATDNPTIVLTLAVG